MNTTMITEYNRRKKEGIKRKSKQSANVSELPNPKMLRHNEQADNSKISEESNHNLEYKSRKNIQKLQILPCKLDSFSVHHTILHNNFCFNVGDIVSLQNGDNVYYAQTRIFVEDAFCEKYVALIWLLPTSARTDTKIGFDPFTFTYGPQDECFYNIKDVKFVMHPPTNYYKRFITTVPKASNIMPIKQKFKPNCRRKI